MKNVRKKFGLALCREEKKEIFDKIVHDTLNCPSVHLMSGKRHFGHGRKKQGWIMYQFVADPFVSYTDFDNFLYILSEELSKIPDLGLVLGHNDEAGFFWMDYPVARSYHQVERRGDA